MMGEACQFTVAVRINIAAVEGEDIHGNVLEALLKVFFVP